MNGYDEKPNIDSEKTANKILQWLKYFAENNFNVFLADERRCIPPSVFLEMARHGLMGLRVPRQYGGLELRYKDYFRIIMQLGAMDASLATLITVNNENGIYPILHYAKPQIRDAFIPLLARGRYLSAMGLTEPSFGTNLTAIQSNARYANHKWLVNGIKRWNSSGWANIINIYASSADSHQKGITGFVITRDMNGVEIGPESLTMGLKSIIQNSIILKNVELTDDFVLGEPHQGIAILEETISHARITACFGLLGAIKRSMQLGHRFWKNRNSSIGKLYDFPAIRVKLNDVLALTYAIEHVANFVAEYLDSGHEIPQIISMILKAFTSELAIHSAELNMKLSGGRGYMETNHLSRVFRDVYASYYGEAANDSLFYLIGQSIAHDAGFFEFISKHFGNDIYTVRFNNILNKWFKNHKTTENNHRTHWLYSCLALPSFYILLNAAMSKSCSSPLFHQEIITLLEQSLYSLENQYGKKTSFPEFKDLDDEIIKYEQSIGNIEFLMAGEENKCDSYLNQSLIQETPEENAHDISKNNEEISSEKLSDISIEELQNFLRERIANILAIPAEQVQPEKTLFAYGLDSLTFFNLSYELEDKFGINFAEEPFPMDVTLKQLVVFVQERIHLEQ